MRFVGPGPNEPHWPNDCLNWKNSKNENNRKRSKGDACKGESSNASFNPVARVAELADAPDLGSGALGRGGSSPLSRTTFFISVLHTYQIY